MTGDDHGHGPDHLYRPLGGLDRWAAVPVDGAAWDGAVERLGRLREADGPWMELVDQGALLAAAYQSGALARLYRGDRAAAVKLLGSGTLDVIAGGGGGGGGGGADPVPHAGAGFEALCSARATPLATVATEGWIRATHAVACRAQVTHDVETRAGVRPHVLGHGDYKHHANHRPTGPGLWRAHAPVSAVGTEMAAFAATLAGGDLRALHPVTRAAYCLHGLAHIRPFAAGSGRVARVLAGAHLLHAASVPLLVHSDDAPAYGAALEAAEDATPGPLVDLVLRCCVDLADLVGGLCRDREAAPDLAAAYARWQRRDEAGSALSALLAAAAEGALARHRARPPASWQSGLPGCSIVAPAGAGGGVRIRCPLGHGRHLEEVLAVAAHPAGGGGPALSAELAGLRLEVDPDAVVPSVSADLAARLDAWLDLAVAGLAVRAAAEADG
ncbi:MAG: Fic family protein [Actinomycetota bacterium]